MIIIHLAGIRGQHGLHGERAPWHWVTIIKDIDSVGTFLFWDVFDDAGAFPELWLYYTWHGLACRAGDPSFQLALTTSFLSAHRKLLILADLHS